MKTYVDFDLKKFVDYDQITSTTRYCTFIDNAEDLDMHMPEILAFIKRSLYLGFDLETSRVDGRDIKKTDSIEWTRDVMSCISISDGVETWVIKNSHIPNSHVRPLMEALMKKPLIGHNIKFDLRFVYRDYGIVPDVIFDTMIGARCVENNKDVYYGLGEVMSRMMKIHMNKELQIANWGKRIIPADMISYCALDTFYLVNLMKKQVELMDLDPATYSTNLKSAYTLAFGVRNKIMHLEMETIKVFTYLEHKGFHVDRQLLSEKMVHAKSMENKMIMKFINTAGENLNPRSPAAVLTLLKKKYPTQGYINELGEFVAVRDLESTKQEFIKPFVDKGLDIIDALYEYRTVMNNIQRLEEFMEGSTFADPRIRTSFKTWGAVSGRTSNPKPNFQNIKNKEKHGINLKKLFTAPNGKKLVVVDFSQIQLVIIAAMTRDPVMMDVITNGPDTGLDLHKMCYSEDTEVLTREGWKLYTEINPTTLIGQYIPETNLIEYVPAGELHLYDHDGDMKHFTGKCNDILVTPNHRMYYRPYHSQEYRIDPADSLVGSAYMFRSGGLVEGTPFDSITWKKQFSDSGRVSRSYGRDITLSPEQLSEWVGFFVSEGCVSESKGGGFRTIISQSLKANPDKVDKIRILMNQFIPFGFKESFDTRHNNVLWTLNHKEFCLWHKENCGGLSNSRKIPDFIKQGPLHCVKLCFDALMLGDGSVDKRGTRDSGYYSTTSKQLADDIQFMAMRLGHKAMITLCPAPKNPKHSQVYKVLLRFNSPEVYSTKPLDVYYKGKVFCYSVPSTIMVTRRNGKISIQGNTAAAVNKIANPLDVTSAQRKQAKAINFGYCFGMGAESFIDYAKNQYDAFFTFEEAKEFRNVYFDTYKNVARWHREVQNSLFRNKYYTETLYGRKAYTYAFTEATNLPVQGLEADIAKLSMIYIHNELVERKLTDRAYMVNMVHDEIVAECDEDIAEDILHLVQGNMEKAGNQILRNVVPVRAEGQIVTNWSDAK